MHRKLAVFHAIIGFGSFFLVFGQSPQASAQAPQYTQAGAEQMLASLPCECAVPIPQDDFSGRWAEFAANSPEEAKTIEALKKIGVVKITDLPRKNGRAYFRVATRDNVDELQLTNRQLETCLAAFVSPPVVRVINITAVKGGEKTQWDGAIVLGTEKYKPTDLYRRYLIARNLPPVGDDKMRVLMKYDPRARTWVRWDWDIAPVSAPDFLSDSVPVGLKRD
jgi:hypothetical protein